ncbi:MAG: aldehyde dehydrogenase family protein [Deltaproteobacteria bacterium]|nr:aldehyde dehydrogenase family protein [Deltaproteobacteria bacterium]MBW2359299.1 aldehyde dehydrogenase family protein [Deltaproteobacteria bacterium]
MSAEPRKLERLVAGQEILFGGDRVASVSAELAAAFVPGDQLRVVERSGELLHIPAAEVAVAAAAVERAQRAFRAMGGVDDEQISRFYEEFAQRLESEEVWSEIAAANAEDVGRATARGRSTTRLVAGDKLRRGMLEGLRGWIGTGSRRGQLIERVDHDGWRAELVGAELGVIAFIFEGRPNVLADATGVLRGGNTVVFRIGSDALGTAQAMMRLALDPALAAAGLPEGSAALVESTSHAAGWALFCDARLSLAVARGSGRAVATLGALAQQAGIPVSLHGTGGAWIVAGASAKPEALTSAVVESLDRKVCNTLNVLCLPRARAAELTPVCLAALDRAGEALGQAYRLHVVEGDEAVVPAAFFEEDVSVTRAEGAVSEKRADRIPEVELATEWEWEQTPEITLKLVDDVDHAVDLFNTYSPQFVASLISENAAEAERFYQRVNAPFVGDGQTRWVDGQKALNRPELGLSNWQHGRLFGRGGVLSGDSVYTVRTRVTSER